MVIALDAVVVLKSLAPLCLSKHCIKLATYTMKHSMPKLKFYSQYILNVKFINFCFIDLEGSVDFVICSAAKTK